MICYRDRTFCPFYKDCKHSASGDCGAGLTDEVRREAKDFGLPIAQYTDKPSCHELLEEDE